MPCTFHLPLGLRFCKYCTANCDEKPQEVKVFTSTNTAPIIMNKEETIERILEIRRVLNEQYIALLYIEPETEQDTKDVATLKGMIQGSCGLLEGYAERLIKSRESR
jgi:hypothetical protein